MQTVSLTPNPPGRAFTRSVAALVQAGGVRIEAAKIAAQWSDQPHVRDFVSKGAVSPGTTTDATWAGPLVQLDPIASEFAALLRPATIIGRMIGIRKVPFNIRYPAQTAGVSMGWVGEYAPSSVSALAFESNILGFAKVSGIVAATKELFDFSAPSSEELLRNDLIAGTGAFLDREFIDPNVAAVAGVSPASITNGATTFQSSGSTATQFADDADLMIGTLADANTLTRPYWVMRNADAARLATKRSTTGGLAFPDITPTGGRLFGIEVLTSNSVPHSTSAGSIIALVDAAEIALADDGAFELDVSSEASIQMTDVPGTGGQTLVSLWQLGLSGVRIVKTMNYRRRRSSGAGVVVLDNVHLV